jgi:hypothetical protein
MDSFRQFEISYFVSNDIFVSHKIKRIKELYDLLCFYLTTTQGENYNIRELT